MLRSRELVRRVPVRHGQLIGERVRDVGIQPQGEVPGCHLDERRNIDEHARSVYNTGQPISGAGGGNELVPASEVFLLPVLRADPGIRMRVVLQQDLPRDLRHHHLK